MRHLLLLRGGALHTDSARSARALPQPAGALRHGQGPAGCQEVAGQTPCGLVGPARGVASSMTRRITTTRVAEPKYRVFVGGFMCVLYMFILLIRLFCLRQSINLPTECSVLVDVARPYNSNNQFNGVLVGSHKKSERIYYSVQSTIRKYIGTN